MRVNSDFISIDPGVGGTGWAHFSSGLLKFVGTITPADPKADWIERVHSVSRKYAGLISMHPGCDAIIMECPSFHGGAAGYAVAAGGDLVKLALLTGALLEVSRRHGFTPTLVLPSGWKGQLTKEATKIRVEDVLKKKFNDITTHACDAVGIGLWALGRF